ncbi:MAG: copper amine oxidase N-terminal domain-containing protein, partial [Clostridiales bacterium]|nr:copper amine oxidase N-terminal domain-containing protein [Clostridiales bacterium]
TYEDGTVVVGTLEVFTDGEYMTIILDTSKNDMWAELFVRWRITRGTEDSAFFYFENGYCEYESYSSKVSTKEQIKGIPVYSLPLHSPYEPSRTGATRAITELFTITVVQNDIPPTPWFEGYTIYTDDFFLTANIWPIPPAQSTSSTVADKSDPVPSVLPPAVDGIKVILNGKALVFDVPPQIVNGRTLVPLRGIFEEMGAAIEYDGATQTVTATKDGTVVILTIGDTSPAINGAVVPIDQPGIIVDGRTLAPLRFVAEAFGGSVEWNGDTQTATITK